MMTTLIRRLQREEEGYSLVIAMLLLSIMMVLLAVSLEAGNASLRQSASVDRVEQVVDGGRGGREPGPSRCSVRAGARPTRVGSRRAPCARAVAASTR